MAIQTKNKKGGHDTIPDVQISPRSSILWAFYYTHSGLTRIFPSFLFKRPWDVYIFTRHTEIYNFIHRTPTIRKEKERERESLYATRVELDDDLESCVCVMPAKFVFFFPLRV